MFIDEHRAEYGVEPICRVLPIAPFTYHARAARQADPIETKLYPSREQAGLFQARKVLR